MSSHKKTLIILTPGFPKDESDTTCLPFLQTFVRSLNKADPSLQIIVLAFHYPFFSKQYVWKNVRVIAFNGRNRGKIFKLILWMKVWRSIKTLVKTNHVIGFLNLWLGECALVGKYASKKYQLPAYSWLWGQDAKEGNKFVKLIKPKSENLIAISDFIANSFETNYKIRPQHIIPIGIDKRMFPNPLLQRNIDILGAGSLIPLKQYDVFVRIITKLSEKRPGISAVILGDGIERKRLQKLIDENKINNNILLAGNTDHKEVLAMMQRSKIFLHPSSYEGFATVFGEALYAGTKLISFVKPMNKTFKNWFIADTEVEMLKQIERILDDPNLENERVLAYDSIEIATDILSLYNSK